MNPWASIYAEKVKRIGGNGKEGAAAPNSFTVWKKHTNKSIIAIGASTGGTEAIAELVKALPAGLPGIIIVQHMPEGFTAMFAGRLHSICNSDVKEAEDGDVIVSNMIYVAPGNYHLRVVKKYSGYAVSIVTGDKVSGHRPSVNVMFKSVADVVGARSIGVILTGMGQDGAHGLLEMRRKGAVTIGQDEESCVVYGMPKVAYEIGAVQYQAPLNRIAPKILELM